MTTHPTAPRTFAEFVQGLDQDRLTVLLRARPDLCVPRPQDLADLAARAATTASIRAILDRLNLFQRTLAETLAALGDPVTAADVASLLPVEEAVVRRGVGELREVALCWGGDDALHVLRGVRTAFEPWPHGVAPQSARPLAPDRIDEALGEVDPAAHEVLRRLAWGPPHGAVRNAERAIERHRATTPVEQLLSRGLLRPLDADTVVLPREVALVLRGGVLVGELTTEPPALTGTARRGRIVDNAAVGAAFEFVHQVEVVADELARTRSTVLRGGGIGTRELAVLGRRVNLVPEQVSFALEVAWAADLIATAAPALTPTVTFDRWLDRDSAARWETLALAWLGGERWYAAAREPGAHTLDPDLVARWAPPTRTLIAGEFAGRIDPAELSARVRWLRPALERVQSLERSVADTVWEANRLGLVALECRTALAAVLDPGGVDPATRSMFPQPGEHLIMQADLTAVATGPLTHRVSADLRLLADQESHGGGGVFRFSPASVRRGFDAGWSAEEIEQWLAGHATTDLPQPLRYLIGDVARRHGAVRVGQAAAYVKVVDDAQARSILSHPTAAELGLRRLGPGVLVAQADADEVVEFLRSAGLAPAAEDAAGNVMRTPGPQRASGSRRTGKRDDPDAGAVAAALVAAEQRVRRQALTTQTTLETLDAALRTATLVEVSFVGNDGTESVMSAVPVTLAAGMVRLVDRGTGTARSIPLARITSAAHPG